MRSLILPTKVLQSSKLRIGVNERVALASRDTTTTTNTTDATLPPPQGVDGRQQR